MKKTKKTKTKSCKYLVIDTLNGHSKLLDTKESAKGYITFVGRSFDDCSVDTFLHYVRVYRVGKQLVVKAKPYITPEGYKGNTLQILG